MSSLNLLKRRVFVSLGVASTAAVVLLSLAGAAAAQQPAPTTPWPVLEVANPSPGAVISSGAYVISGDAFDPTATQGSGISRVDLFLGDRDQGGVFLGSAVPGQDAMPGLTPGSAAALDSFQLTVTLPTGMTGGQDFVAYAYSGESGKVTTVSMPIFVALEPTPMATPATQPVAEVGHLVVAPASTLATFNLANPNSGDVVLYGDYVVSGTAVAGIDRVEVFIDERDSGGTMLGAATPAANGTFTLTVKIPTTFAGGHNFVAYAVSSATGQETKVSVPIYIGTAPTPTPRPTS